MKPLQLDRLPKAGRLRSLRFKRTTPGNFTRLIAPSTERGRINPAIVDPSHPWAKQPSFQYSRKLPCFRNDVLTVHAYPKALLALPVKTLPDIKEFAPAAPTPYGEDGKVKGGRKKLNMSLAFIVGKANVHKFSVVRSGIKRKVKAAVALIVTRDVVVKKDEKGKEVLVSGGSGDGEKWILQDWTYVFRPSLEVYRMPLPTLVTNIQQALEHVNTASRKLDLIWKITKSSMILQREQRESPSPASRLALNASKPKSKRVVTAAAQEGESEKKRSWAHSIANFSALLMPFLKENKAKAIDPLLNERDLLPSKEDFLDMEKREEREERKRREKREKRKDRVGGEVRNVSAEERMFSRKPILKIPDEEWEKTRQGRKR